MHAASMLDLRRNGVFTTNPLIIGRNMNEYALSIPSLNYIDSNILHKIL